MTDGSNSLATANKARTSFSPSPNCNRDDGKNLKTMAVLGYTVNVV